MFLLDNEINIKIILKFLKKYLFISVVLSVLVATLVTVTYQVCHAPRYRADSTLVQTDGDDTLVLSFPQVTRARSFRQAVKQHVANGKWASYDKKNQFQVTLEPSKRKPSEFRIIVTSKSKKYSQYLAVLTDKLFRKQVKQHFDNSAVRDVKTTEKVTTVSVKGNLMKAWLVSFVVAVVLISGLFLRRMLFRGRVQDPNYIEEVFGIKKIGTLISVKDRT